MELESPGCRVRPLIVVIATLTLNWLFIMQQRHPCCRFRAPFCAHHPACQREREHITVSAAWRWPYKNFLQPLFNNAMTSGGRDFYSRRVRCVLMCKYAPLGRMHVCVCLLMLSLLKARANVTWSTKRVVFGRRAQFTWWIQMQRASERPVCTAPQSA